MKSGPTLRVFLQNLKLLIVVESKVNVTINHLINVLGGCDKVKKKKGTENFWVPPSAHAISTGGVKLRS